MSALEIIPSLRYKDCKKAIEWLCDTWGFKKDMVIDGKGENEVAHAQLSLGKVMIMVGSKRDDSAWSKTQIIPGEIEGKVTQSPYVVVDDADWFYNKAKEAGAKIIRDVQDEDYGGRGFECADIGGHIWCFGTYNPRESHEENASKKRKVEENGDAESSEAKTEEKKEE
mmetsp:Transcript_10814/g.14104  ORF Transcript_10814/g.14104 Transcript_10814/m.14104 type:complete len:169 (-) Transcript_10814:1275-1781(-)